MHRGHVIGLLGNSGNTDGPHLHFHVMDSPSPLASNGLPFTFKSFTGMGVTTDEETLFDGNPVPVVQNALAGPHGSQLPLNDQLLDLPPGRRIGLGDRQEAGKWSFAFRALRSPGR